jgi:DNA polymerase-3 subunit beta
VSADELRPVMCGLYFDIKDNHLNVCATDARRLYTDSNPYISEKEFSFIVSGGALSAINDIASLSSKDLLFEINQSNIRIKSDDCDIVCRNVEGRFPNFRAVVISDDAIKTKVRFVTQDFISMLNRMSIVNKGTNRLLILDINNGKCNVMSEDVDFNKKNVENIECEIKGEDVKIGLNTEYLLNMVQTIDNDKFVMYIAESNRPILIREQTKPNKTLLLTPMTL